MKKLLLMSIFAVFAIGSVNAQNFGVKAGLDLASVKVEISGNSASGSETGFYVGGFADLEVSDSFHFQPEVLFVSVNDFNQIHIPLMAKFPVAESLNVLAGPALGLLLDSGDGMSSFNYGIEAGASYDINEEFFLEARYSLGLANLIEDAPSGFSTKLSGFFIGAGYRF